MSTPASRTRAAKDGSFTRAAGQTGTPIFAACASRVAPLKPLGDGAARVATSSCDVLVTARRACSPAASPATRRIFTEGPPSRRGPRVERQPPLGLEPGEEGVSGQDRALEIGLRGRVHEAVRAAAEDRVAVGEGLHGDGLEAA